MIKCTKLRYNDKTNIIFHISPDVMSSSGGDGIFWVTTDRGEAMADTHAYSLQYHGCYGRRDAITRSHIEKDFIAFKSSTPRKRFQRGDALNLLLLSV